MKTQGGLPQVRVAVATYRRPELLALMLPALVEQAASVAYPTSVLVVDNDPQGSAAEVVASFQEAGVGYVVEPSPGIAAARNRAIDECAVARFVVFIDDDERPADRWLQTLLDTWSRFQCAAVVGPVVSEFRIPPSSWVRGSGVFDSARRTTGVVVEGAATNNLLLDLQQLRNFGFRFDERFGLTGGSDSMLTRTMSRHGLQIRWCAEARVTEFVPPDRATRHWVLKRTLRTSNAWSRVALALEPRPLQRGGQRIKLTALAVVRGLRGSAAFLSAVVARNLAKRAGAECEVVRSVGMLTGAWGLVRSEYSRPPEPTVDRISVARRSLSGPSAASHSSPFPVSSKQAGVERPAEQH